MQYLRNILNIIRKLLSSFLKLFEIYAHVTKKYSGLTIKRKKVEKHAYLYSPKGRSCVLDGVRTMGRLALALLALLKPVAEVSTSDIIPGSSSYTLEGGGWYSE